jgi:hypothetical protein
MYVDNVVIQADAFLYVVKTSVCGGENQGVSMRRG